MDRFNKLVAMAEGIAKETRSDDKLASIAEEAYLEDVDSNTFHDHLRQIAAERFIAQLAMIALAEKYAKAKEKQEYDITTGKPFVGGHSNHAGKERDDKDKHKDFIDEVAAVNRNRDW